MILGNFLGGTPIIGDRSIVYQMIRVIICNERNDSTESESSHETTRQWKPGVKCSE